MAIEDVRRRWEAAVLERGRCPECESARVRFNGIRRRTATVVDGEESVFLCDIPVRRLWCGDCGHRWSRAPEGVTTRGHYQPSVVARAVARAAEEGVTVAVAREHGCHRRTLGRFIDRVAAVAEPAELGRLLVVAHDTTTLPAMKAQCPSRSEARRARLSRAMGVLALLEALAALHGWEPPGLAHAHRLVPANAPTGVAKEGASSRA